LKMPDALDADGALPEIISRNQTVDQARYPLSGVPLRSTHRVGQLTLIPAQTLTPEAQSLIRKSEAQSLIRKSEAQSLIRKSEAQSIIRKSRDTS
jgi:hypothetical protein